LLECRLDPDLDPSDVLLFRLDSATPDCVAARRLFDAAFALTSGPAAPSRGTVPASPSTIHEARHALITKETK
jgi:hypothetical protein